MGKDNSIRIVYVYKITSPSNRIYVGSTFDWKRRLRDYKNVNCKTQTKLLYSLQKYGVDAHVFEIIEECVFIERNRRESYWGCFYDVLGENGLNCVLPKSEDYIGISEETRIKFRNRPKPTEIQNEANRIRNTGKKHTPEAIEKCREAKIGNPSFTGKTHRPETIAKMCIAQKGRIITEESKQKRKQTISSRPPTEKEIASRLNAKNSKTVFNTETGIYYSSVKEAQRYSQYAGGILGGMLSGQQKNKSSYIYV